MPPRFVMDTDGPGGVGRLVISKPGHNALDPALADANKIFDSAWNFGGAIVEVGYAWLPHYGTNQSGPSPAGQTTFYNFRNPLSYTPSVLLFDVIPKGSYTSSGALNNQMTMRGSHNPRWQHRTNAGDRPVLGPFAETNRVGFPSPNGAYYPLWGGVSRPTPTGPNERVVMVVVFGI